MKEIVRPVPIFWEKVGEDIFVYHLIDQRAEYKVALEAGEWWAVNGKLPGIIQLDNYFLENPHLRFLTNNAPEVHDIYFIPNIPEREREDDDE